MKIIKLLAIVIISGALTLCVVDYLYDIPFIYGNKASVVLGIIILLRLFSDILEKDERVEK